jgi:pyruvate dehydrogenase E1 component alpha subunit
MAGARRGLATEVEISGEETITIDLPTMAFEVYECEQPEHSVTIAKKELLDMYREMVVIRRMEMAADGLYKAKLIRGFCHLCTGQVSLHTHIYIYI